MDCLNILFQSFKLQRYTSNNEKNHRSDRFIGFLSLLFIIIALYSTRSLKKKQLIPVSVQFKIIIIIINLTCFS